MKIIEFGNPILNQKTEEIKLSHINSTETRGLIEDLVQTCKEFESSSGLAAPQIGSNKSIFVIRAGFGWRNFSFKINNIIINPAILKYSGKQNIIKSICLSSPKNSKPIKIMRYSKIKVSYYNEKAKLKIKTLRGLRACTFQHEIDHLEGITILEREIY